MLDFDRRVPAVPEALAAVRELEETVAARERQFGPDDPRTVGSRLRLAEAYEELDDVGGEGDLDVLAEAALAGAVDSRIRTLGAEHPDTLSPRYDLAVLRLRRAVQDGLAGQDDIIAEFRSIAEAAARELGSAHPMTLAVRSRLAAHCPEPERSDLRARVTRGWEEVLAEREQHLGPDDPRTLDAMQRLVAQYRDERGADARRLAQRLTAGWGRVAAAAARDLGPVHPRTAMLRDRHLRLVDAWVAPGTGARLFEELAADHVRLLGPDHPRTLRVQLELLRSWKGLPGFATAETVASAERLLDRFRDVLGPDHDDFRMLRHHLMSQRLSEGRVDAAFALKRRYPSPSDEEEPRAGGHHGVV
ncbi:hypothetical protein Asp14428_75320 [Actinoplanes sp. NBRC 14428]|nr:hypothetical protein Asp14428_75320 [Actinoplanes sp. NBRC 14428]